MFGGFAIKPKPEYKPDKTGGPGDDEGAAPSQPGVKERYGRRHCHRAEVGAGVEDAGGERAFFLGEPFGYGFDASGEVRGLAESKEKKGDTESQRRDRGAGEHRRDTP